SSLLRRHPGFTLFPYTTLFRSRAALRWLVNRLPTSTGKVTLEFLLKQFVAGAELPPVERHLTWFGALGPDDRVMAWADGLLRGLDRKSTRLNSSHDQISYAVFC